MKKSILYIIIAGISILLSGCGSDSRKDPFIPIPPPNVHGYAFQNLTSDLDITSYGTYKISFQLTKDDLVVPSAIVRMKIVDKNIGSINQYTTATNDNGEGNFIYTPPAIFPDENAILTIVFTDDNITLEEKINLDFELESDSDRATTLSIVYETTECDVRRGIVSHYHVHAVNRKANTPIVGIPVKVSLINGVIEINGEKVQNEKGGISQYTPVEFKGSVNFETQTDVKIGDNLIIFPTKKAKNSIYLGGWDIATVYHNLVFSDDGYTNLVNATGLTYIVGNEERLLGGSDGEIGELVNAHIESIENEDSTDEDGYSYFDIVYDPKLAGHTVSVEAHGDDNGNRIGVASKVFLRLDGDDFSASETTIPNDVMGVKQVEMNLKINPSCMGNVSLINVEVNPNSFTATPEENCVVVGAGNRTDGDGNIGVAIRTDGNITATTKCTISWDGGPESLRYEY